ncbi:hypothetical protein ZEAMMB73_Zm00001d050041 [Zea mays]|uniref:Uncharacterized protein n=1 Tax=Zea mays TaxID=4577 RepID=A0A1D6PZI3_MAIZE|nr:hypothetical protein ZEAMMB73_Zm00001d050041 [Zea mays]
MALAPWGRRALRLGASTASAHGSEAEQGDGVGEKGRGAGAAIYRAKLWTWQTALAGGRCDSASIGRQFSSFSVWNRTQITANDLFLDVYSTNHVQDLRRFEHWLESYRPTKTGLSVS